MSTVATRFYDEDLPARYQVRIEVGNTLQDATPIANDSFRDEADDDESERFDLDDEANWVLPEDDDICAERFRSCDSKGLGRLGEELAARFLVSRGYRILHRNMKSHYGEADIVAQREDLVAIIEVKTRRGVDPVPEEMVDGKKLARYRNICLDYLMCNPEVTNLRFDVIGVNVIEPGVARLGYLTHVCEWDG